MLNFNSINAYSPLEQFEIFKIGYFSILNNSTIFMLFSFVVLVYFFMYMQNTCLIIPNPWQQVLELPFQFIKNIVTENINIKYQVYFPYIFLYFLSILCYNLFGMIPYSFTVTSHLILTFY